jgi:hypothetical protein
MAKIPDVIFQAEPALTADEFIAVLKASTLAERRPVSDRACVEGMLAHADLTITARLGTRLVGVSLGDRLSLLLLSVGPGRRRTVPEAEHRRRADSRNAGSLATDVQTAPAVGPGCRRLLFEDRIRTSSPGVDHSAIRWKSALNSCPDLKIPARFRLMFEQYGRRRTGSRLRSVGCRAWVAALIVAIASSTAVSAVPHVGHDADQDCAVCKLGQGPLADLPDDARLPRPEAAAAAGDTLTPWVLATATSPVPPRGPPLA